MIIHRLDRFPSVLILVKILSVLVISCNSCEAHREPQIRFPSVLILAKILRVLVIFCTNCEAHCEPQILIPV